MRTLHICSFFGLCILLLQLLVVFKMVGFQVLLNHIGLNVANWTNPLQAFSSMHLRHVDAEVGYGVSFVITKVTEKIFNLLMYVLYVCFQTMGADKSFVTLITRKPCDFLLCMTTLDVFFQ